MQDKALHAEGICAFAALNTYMSAIVVHLNYYIFVKVHLLVWPEQGLT